MEGKNVTQILRLCDLISEAHWGETQHPEPDSDPGVSSLAKQCQAFPRRWTKGVLEPPKALIQKPLLSPVRLFDLASPRLSEAHNATELLSLARLETTNKLPAQD